MLLLGIIGEAKKAARKGQSRPVWDREKCTLCGGCVPVCDADAIAVFETFLEMDASRCRLCGDCVRGCPAGALRIERSAPERPQGHCRTVFLAEVPSVPRLSGQGSGMANKMRIGGGRG